jgi:hypothetical protein
MFQTKVVEKFKTHFSYPIILFDTPAVYEIMWENIVQPAGHRWQYGACALHAGYLRLRTHTWNM